MRCHSVKILTALSASLFFGAQPHAAEPPDCGLYTYKAEIVRVIDGDTVVADIDLGFNVWLRDEHLRLEGVDAPERGSDGAVRATDALVQRVEGQQVFICTTKAKRSDDEARGSFGRHLVRIYHEDRNLNDWLLQSGLVCPNKRGEKCQK